METTKTKKMSLLMVVIAVIGLAALKVTPDNGYQTMMENALIRKIKHNLSTYNTQLPEDRLYIQTDKPLYSTGDDIWFSTLVLEGQSLRASSKSDIVHVELISPKGTVDKSIKLICKNGRAAGDFHLEEGTVGGLYKLRAYTNWMKNEGENKVFEKEIQIQDVVLPHLKMKLDFEKKAFGPGDEVIAKLQLNSNENKALIHHPIKFTGNIDGSKHTEQSSKTDEEGICYIKFKLPAKLKSNDGLLNAMIEYNGNTESISRSIPIVLNKIKLVFYPEGGDLVNDIESKVAFKALNEFGKAADIEGIVVDELGNELTTIQSFHQGMGAFYLTPERKKSYFVKITKPTNIADNYPLPEALNRGYVLSVNNHEKNQVGIVVQSTESEELSLVAQVRGEIVYSTVIRSLAGKNEFFISTENFPTGIAQFTLFDAKGIARAERLAFVNKDKHLNISFQTDKSKYLPREKIKLTVLVKDERGLPSPANIVLSVVNDQLVSFADDRSGHILSSLYLEQDLNQKVEEPKFYFDTNEKKANEALDYLMLTSGYRRFTWEKIMEEELPAISFPGKKAILAGKIIDGHSGKELPFAKIHLPNGNQYTADKQGKFSIPNVELYESISLQVSADGFGTQTYYMSDYADNLSLYLYKYRLEEISRTQMKRQEFEVDFAEEQLVNLADVADGEGRMMAPVAAIKSVKHQSQARLNQPKAAPGNIAKDEKILPAQGMAMEDMIFARDDRNVKEVKNLRQAHSTLYYRARVFNAPNYENQKPVETRTDFRNTIYWNPNVEIGYSGRKTLEFFASDDITSFRINAEGISKDGNVGRGENTIYTQLPFDMQIKMPLEVVSEDLLTFPLTLRNNTNGPLGGVLRLQSPASLISISTIDSVQTIMPGQAKTLFLKYKVSDRIGEDLFQASFQTCGLSDAFTQKIKIVAKGFPKSISFSAQDLQKEYNFETNHLVKGSLKASFTAFPNVVNDLMKGVEGILSEPYGCFEQTSCTAYPNAMVLDYLKNTDSKDTKVLARATDLLDRGYKRLTSFETSNKGYEWFGANPAHEGLTAYGIMEFVDMQKAGQTIDQQMLDRTVQWLMNHKDGKGGFEREKRALHDFGRISDDVLNGYIVYALAEAGYKDIQKEFEATNKTAMQSKDAYLLAMTCNAAYALNNIKKATEAYHELIALQEKDGSINGSSHSITYSQGQSLRIETTALSLMAMLKSPLKNEADINAAVKYLVSARSGSGVFSSTQGTILALKSLTEYAKYSKRVPENGRIEIYVDRKKVMEKEFKAGDKGEIQLNGLEDFIQGEGKHNIKVVYKNVKQALPYSIAINWNTTLPKSDESCLIDLKTVLTNTQVNVGETSRLKIQIINKSEQEVPSTVAIIGIPAGLTAQAWQLKELQEKNTFDYFEIKGNTIAIYYRGLDAKSVKDIQLDLKAELPGTYEASASCAYLYYTNEFKSWTAGQKITIVSN